MALSLCSTEKLLRLRSNATLLLLVYAISIHIVDPGSYPLSTKNALRTPVTLLVHAHKDPAGCNSLPWSWTSSPSRACRHLRHGNALYTTRALIKIKERHY